MAATDEYLKRAINSNKQYDDLPPKVRAVLPVADYRAKCAQALVCLAPLLCA